MLVSRAALAVGLDAAASVAVPEGGTSPVRVSVIVPARNAALTLGECLEALAREGVPGERTASELLVVDDRSVDATHCIADRAPGVRVLLGAGRGPAAARNLGARTARGETLVFLDADTAPCRGWLCALLAPLEDDERAVAVKGRYQTQQTSVVARFAQLELGAKYDRLARAEQVDFVDSGTAAYRRRVFLAAGGYDEGFPEQSAEDVDLSFRLAASGARMCFAPQAAVLHRHAATLHAYLAKKSRYGYFRVRVYRRFPRKTLGDSYTPPVMALQIALTGVACASAPAALFRVRCCATVFQGSLLIFALTTVPLMRRARAIRASTPALVPAFVFARSLAQGLGILVGVAALLAEVLGKRRPVEWVVQRVRPGI